MSSDLHLSMVTIYVSPDKVPFYLHKERLCQHSRFFAKAFDGGFVEANTKSMTMKDEGVEEFKLLEEWLYRGKFTPPKYGEPTADSQRSFLLIKLFCFAEKVEIMKLQNMALDRIRNFATTTLSTIDNRFRDIFTTKQSPYHSPLAIEHAYSHTPPHSPLRRLLSELFAYNVDPHSPGLDLEDYPKEFVSEVCLLNMKRLPFRLQGEKAGFDDDVEQNHIKPRSCSTLFKDRT